MGVIEVWAVFARVPNRVVSNLCFHCRSAKRSVCEGGWWADVPRQPNPFGVC